MNNLWLCFDPKTHLLVNVCETEAQAFAEKQRGSVEIFCTETCDKLDRMLQIQDQFQKRIGYKYDNEYIMKQALYAEDELHEFLRELEGFKDWKHYDWDDETRAQHQELAKEEFVDFIHFVLNIGNALGMSATDIFEYYINKNIKNHLRQDNNY